MDQEYNAQHSGMSKSDFLSHMSHEIRTPLNAIIGLSSLGSQQTDNSLLTQDYFDKINFSARFLLGVVNDLLDISKLDSESLTQTVETISLEEFVKSIRELISPLIEKNAIQLQLDLPSDCTLMVSMDLQRSRQIYVNLLSNAILFAPKGSTIGWSIRYTLVDRNQICFITSIQAPGCGISRDLSMVQKMVDQMDGTLTLQNLSDSGTVVTVSVVRNITPSAPNSCLEKVVSSNEGRLWGKRVLLVEDNEINRIVTERILEKWNMKVLTAINGKESVHMFQTQPLFYFDFILMDIRMPIMDGLEAAKTIRSLPRKDARSIPIIALSANAYAEDSQKSLDAGMNVHLAKPVIPRELKRTLLMVAD